MIIRAASAADHDGIWRILEPTIRAGETYALPRDMSREAALAGWFAAENEVFVAELDGALLGTYLLHPNRAGGGDHVANCGYMTAPDAYGRGIARAMCAHSLAHARARGYRAMQFNFVIASNTRAVALWQAMGFSILARQPEAFRHPVNGYVDALVMHQAL